MPMTPQLDELLWPEAKLQQGLSLLGAHMGSTNTLHQPSKRWDMADHPNEWLREQTDLIDLSTQRVEIPLGQLGDEIVDIGPCLIGLTDGHNQNAYLVIAQTSKRGLKVYALDGTIKQMSFEMLLDGFIRSLKNTRPNDQKTGHQSDPKPVGEMINCFKEATGDLSESVQRNLFVSLLADININRIWAFSNKEKDKIRDEVAAQGGVRHLSGFVFGLLATPIFYILSWFILGSNVMTGRLGSQWLSIWIVLLAGYIVARLYTRKKQVELSLLISVLIKRRMLLGMTSMGLEEAKHKGPCHLLTRCYESNQFESNSVGMVLGAINAVITLFIAMGSLILLQLWGLLFAFLLASSLAIFVMFKLYHIEVNWTRDRINLTHTLAELMIGQRTRRVQEDPALRHLAQDEKLAKFLTLQTHRNKWQVVYAMVPSCWNITGFSVLLYTFVTSSGSDTLIDLPAAAGIWLLVSISISQLSSIYLQAVQVVVAWQNISSMLNSRPKTARYKTDLSQPGAQTDLTPDSSHQRLLEIRDLAYSYPGRNTEVLDGFNLLLNNNDKIILEGHSGSGKSTLISLLTGIRPPSRGSILLGGVEQNMLSSEQWGSRVVMVPQYHENYLFTETLAFNLLLGTQWPAEPEQLEEAEMICDELGLTTLLDSMPAGLQQVVGEMGWTLSHGEKSRVFVARAILQHPELIILDESLASLDPENSHRVLACVEKHCKAVIIVAHP